MSSSVNQKSYNQRYRKQWESQEQFKAWLKPYPGNSNLAYCDICHVVIKAHFCDLQKHGSTKKHLKAVELWSILHVEEEKDTQPAEGNIPLLQLQIEEEKYFGKEYMASEGEISPQAMRWTADAVDALILHIKAYWKDFQGGFRKKKVVWGDVSEALSRDNIHVDATECAKKFRNIKARYFMALEKRMMKEKPVIRIDYFDELHQLLGKDSKTSAYLEERKTKMKDNVKGSIGSEEDYEETESSGFDVENDGNMEWNAVAVDFFLQLLMEFKDCSGKDDAADKAIWKEIAQHMRGNGNQVTEAQCQRKWVNLVKQHDYFKTLSDKTGSLTVWPFYTKVRHVKNMVKIPLNGAVEETRINLKRSKKQSNSPKNAKKVRKHLSSEDVDDPLAIEESLGDDPQRNVKAKPGTSSASERTLRRVKKLEENAAIWKRLHTMELRLDDLSDQQEIEQDTRNMLTQILSQLSVLVSHITPQSSQPSTHITDGITIVIPNNEHNPQ